MTPVPESLVLELVEPREPGRIVAGEIELDVDELELTELAREFLVDAASTPTGYWRAPSEVYAADPEKFSRTLHELHAEGVVEWRGSGLVKVTMKGRSTARSLKARGQMGYEETHALSSGEAERREVT